MEMKGTRKRKRGSYGVGVGVGGGGGGGGGEVSQYRFPTKILTHTWSQIVTVEQVTWMKSDYLIQLNLIAIGCEQQNPVHGIVKAHCHAYRRCFLTTAVSTDFVWNSRYIQWGAQFLERTCKQNADHQVTQKPNLHSTYTDHNQLWN